MKLKRCIYLVTEFSSSILMVLLDRRQNLTWLVSPSSFKILQPPQCTPSSSLFDDFEQFCHLDMLAMVTQEFPRNVKWLNSIDQVPTMWVRKRNAAHSPCMPNCRILWLARGQNPLGRFHI